MCGLRSPLLHVFSVYSSNSFRVFDREAEGEVYAAARQRLLAKADFNILGQPNLNIEPRVRYCPRYNHFLHGDVRVGLSSILTGHIVITYPQC